MEDKKIKKQWPNTAQRHRIYSDALAGYRKMIDQRKIFTLYGLCYAIRNYTNVKTYGIDPYISISRLPELKSLRPNHMRSHWFPTSNTKSRIAILEKCIRMTAPKQPRIDRLRKLIEKSTKIK